MTAVDIAKRVASGVFKLGFQTPSLAYGADYILGFDGVTREKLNAGRARARANEVVIIGLGA
jgi:hypothetical protein